MQEVNQTKLLELARKLISFKSISPNQDGCLDYIQDYLTNLGFTTTRLDRGNTSNLIALIGTQQPIFAFAGHIDVVPPGDINKWPSDPFVLEEKNGLLYGRGIGDMKGAVAAFLIAVAHYLSHAQLTDKSIAILLTSDEEGAATDGTIVMVEYLKQQGITLDYCLLGEPTSVNKLGDVIKIGRRGSLTGKLEIVGKQGHIAYPELCRNPIHMFAEALLELSKISWDNGNEYFPATTLQFANLNAGLGVDNVVPGTLYTSFNFRYNNLHTAESLSKRFTDILDQHQLPYKIKWNNSAKPFLTIPGRLIAVISDAIKHQQSITPQLKTDGGTSDGRFLVEVAKELVECGLSNMHIHQVGENICKTDLFDLANLYYIILNKIFNE